MARCYVAASADALGAARDAALAATGVRVFRGLRGEGLSGPGGREECYFEWVLGPEQLLLDDDLVLRAWEALLAAL